MDLICNTCNNDELPQGRQSKAWCPGDQTGLDTPDFTTALNGEPTVAPRQIVDVWSRALLGYHVSLNREYSRYDVIRTIENALAPHRLRKFTLPGVGYGAAGGFPSGKLMELGYATWQWFKLDNAKANLAGDVQYALADFIGCFIDAGPAHSPDDRPYIERFFTQCLTNSSFRLTNSTFNRSARSRCAM